MRGVPAELGAPFRRLLFSDALTILSLMVGQVALPWWIASQGGARDLALNAVILSGAAIVAMPLLSPLGDRHPKRALISGALLAFAASAFGFALLASIGHYRIVWLIALGLVPMLAMAVMLPAISSFSSELVPPALLGRAISLQQGAQASGRLVGPALGGLVLAAVGTAPALWLQGGLLVAAALLARRLPAGEPTGAASDRAGWRAELQAGFRANWAIPMERGWILVNFLSWIFLFPTFTMLVPLKVQSLGLSAVWLGLCEAGLSLGMLLGAMGGSAWMVARFGRFATRVGAAGVQGVALAVAGWTDHPVLLVAAFSVAGLMNAAMVLVGMTHRMLARPQAFRARMVAGAITTTHVASTLGPAIAGAALLHWPVATVFMGCALAGMTAALGLVLVPGMRAFMALAPEQVDGYYARQYPQVFDEG